MLKDDFQFSESMFIFQIKRNLIGSIMSTTPYNLASFEANNEKPNSNKYYKVVADLSDRLILDAEKNFAGIINGYEQYIAANSIENKRHRSEYLVDLLAIGVLWNVYISNAMAAKFIVNKFSHALAQLKPEDPHTEAAVGKLRSQIINEYLLEHSDEPPVADIDNYKLLLDWLISASCFSEEVMRMMKWEGYFSSLEEQKLSSTLNNIINYAFDFSDNAFPVLHNFTNGLLDFLESSFSKEDYSDDIIMQIRSEEEYHFNMIANHLINKTQKEAFKSRKKKIVLLPSCLSPEISPDENDKFHQKCRDSKCNSGKINKIINDLGNENIEVRTVPHRFFSKIFLEFANSEDTAILAIVCSLGLYATALEMRRLNIPCQVMPLDHASCAKYWDKDGYATELNTEQLLKILM